MTVWISDMTTLVVPLDGRDESVRAVPVAGRLSNRLGIGIQLIGAGNEAEDERMAWMQAVADRYLPDSKVEIRLVPDAEPVDAIVAAAGTTGLVCMATAASLLPHQGHIGSVAEGVTRDLLRPLFLVGPEMTPDPGESTQRIIVPVDGSPLSETAIPIAAELAKKLAVPLWIVSIVSPQQQRDAEAQMGQDIGAAESGYVRGLAKGIDNGIDAEWEVLHGNDQAGAIVDFTGDDGTIFMTTHGRSGLTRLFGGSVATAVVARSKRAVIVYRPIRPSEMSDL
ncbi:MAG: universal stress protein [Acidimicrobiia bacterium]|nr:universal stress protein [Acidimicrobiia bacterium]